MFFKYSFIHESVYSPKQLKECFSDSDFACENWYYSYNELSENRIELKPTSMVDWLTLRSVANGYRIYVDFEPTQNGTLCKFTLEPTIIDNIARIALVIAFLLHEIILQFFVMDSVTFDNKFKLRFVVFAFVIVGYYIALDLIASDYKRELIKMI